MLSPMRRRERAVSDWNHVLEIIQSCDCCRVAFSEPDGPYIVPMNFGIESSQEGQMVLYFHGASAGKKPVARIRRKSSSKRSAAAKAKRKRRHWRSRNLSKPKPGGWNFSRTGRRRKMSAICRKAVTGAANATARGKQASGAVTNCICPSATEEFRWRRF